MDMKEPTLGLDRRCATAGNRFPGIMSLLAICLVAVIALPVSSTSVMAADAQAQETQPAATDGQAGTAQTNPRSDYWREVRQGNVGTTVIRGQETSVLINAPGEAWRQFRAGTVIVLGGWVLVGVIGALALYHLLTGGAKLGDRSGVMIFRWSVSDRFIHWYTAVLFLLLMITGMSILWGRDLLIPVMGKEGFAAWAAIAKPVHDYSAAFFVVGLVLMWLKWFKHNIPRAYDLEWIKKGGGYLGGDEHPPAGFTNAGEKMFFWTLVFAGGAMVVSGAFLLFPNMGWDRQTMAIANIVHSVSSLVTIAFVFLHIYLATIGNEGSFEAMVSGEVDENWAKKHHDVWYDEVKEQQSG
jgi:formate dehydrogenase subunit gamma